MTDDPDGAGADGGPGADGGAGGGDGGAGTTGAACTTNDDCHGLLCIPERDPATNELTRFAGGYCTEVGCASGKAQCPGGSTCLGAPEGVCLADCASSDGCRGGYVCVPTLDGGVCVPACTSDDHCPGGFCVLSAGRCGNDISEVPVGAACEVDAQCAGGVCIGAADGFPGGYCTGAPCDPEAALEPMTCPAGAACFVAQTTSLCLAGCTDDAGCRPAYVCLGERCLPACTAEAGCGAAQVCDTASGRCVPDLRLAQGVGGACTDGGTDCGAGGICLAAQVDGADTGFVGGYCTGLACLPGVAGRACPAGSTCFGEGAGALCLDACDPAGPDCRDGYQCAPLSSGGVCLPRCRSDLECDPAGAEHLRCDGVTGRCAPLFDDVPVGASCATDEACGTNGLCLQPDAAGRFAGGYCTGTPCSSESPCPSGSRCTGTSAALCLDACASAGECRPGYVCAGAVCVPACLDALDCGTGLLCELSTGHCLPDFADVPVGAACADSSACGTWGVCFGAADGFPSGYCAAVGCSASNPCPAGSLCQDQGGTTMCLATCAATTSCRTGYRCFQLTAGNACLP